MKQQRYKYTYDNYIISSLYMHYILICWFQNETEIKSISEKGTRISNILATRRETVGTFKQQVKDHEKRIIRRNRLLNDALQAWNFDTVEQDVSEIGIKNFFK